MTARIVSASYCALLACFNGLAHGGSASNAAEQVTIRLRIAAQPLDDALQEFSRQSNIQIIFFSHVTKGTRSRGANGTFTLNEALKALLTGSGLSFRIINSRTVQVFRSE